MTKKVHALLLATWTSACASSTTTEHAPDIDESAIEATAPAANNPALDAMVVAKLDATRSPGIAAAIVKGSQLKWANGFGRAHIAKNVPVTADTLFLLASVSKTVTAAATMQLVERGSLQLDGAVDDVVGFSVKHPQSPTPVTTRMLLTHTASILDPDRDFQVAGDTPIGLERYLRGTLVPGGEYYSRSNWGSKPPGLAHAYSNTGVTLLGYLVQKAAGVSFESFCKTNLFEPLGMNESSWHLADLDPAHIAMPYEGSPGRYREAGLYTYADFPAGTLRTSVKQLARFLGMFISGGEIDGKRILKSETVAEMKRLQIPTLEPNYGLIWYYESHGTRRVLMHDGADTGVSTLMGFDPATNVGAIVLTNGAGADYDASNAALVDLFDRLLAEGERL